MLRQKCYNKQYSRDLNHLIHIRSICQYRGGKNPGAGARKPGAEFFAANYTHQYLVEKLVTSFETWVASSTK